jgi:hypothetical protein
VRAGGRISFPVTSRTRSPSLRTWRHQAQIHVGQRLLEGAHHVVRLAPRGEHIRYGAGRKPAARAFSHTSIPVRPGIIQSSTATGGPAAPLSARHASSPLATTVDAWSACFTACASTRRAIASSSAISTGTAGASPSTRAATTGSWTS